MPSSEHARGTEAHVRNVLERYADELMRYPNATGVGIQEEVLPNGESMLVIHIYVSKQPTPAALHASASLPEQIDGVKIRVREVGTFRFE